MRRVATVEEMWSGEGDPKPGDFIITTSTVDQANPVLKPIEGQPTVEVRSILMCMPDGVVVSLPIRPVPKTGKLINGGHSWQWDGNEEKPTLTPSVHCIGRWHGFITAGRMVSC